MSFIFFSTHGSWFSSYCYLLRCLLILVTLKCTAWNGSYCFLHLCRHKVVIVEGNYLLLEGGIWKEISSLFDEKWQVSVLQRHIFLLIFYCWPWSFGCCMLTLLRIQLWTCDSLCLTISSVKIILMEDYYMFTESHIQLIFSCWLLHTGSVSLLLSLTSFWFLNPK